MQLGVVHEAAAEVALQAGIEVVMDRCMKIEHARSSGGLPTLGLNTGVISARRFRPPALVPKKRASGLEPDHITG